MPVKGFDDTIAWYDDNADAYASAVGTTVLNDAIEKFLKHLPASPRILDAGCGSGRDSKVFHDKGGNVTGVDISEGLLGIARKNNPDIEFVQADFRELPLEENTFDGVWALASLVHFESLEDARKALLEFHRVLKNGGVVYVAVKAKVGDKATDVVADKVSKHERFFRYYAQDELETLMKDAGFTLISTELADDPHGRTDTKWVEIIAKKSG